MEYLSTRDKNLRVSASQAIQLGLSRDGGLFAPVHFPKLGALDLETLCDMNYNRRAAYVMGKYLENFSTEELRTYAESAYGADKFDSPAVAPLRRMDGNTWCLELWHGPTGAFKDLALQTLPHLLSASLRKTGEEKTACILAATSGDTGKAALEGFADMAQTKILVFYPENGVSRIQKLQMVTQTGKNVGVCAVRGNFDDAQNGVKRIFSDAAMGRALEERGCFLSSANSINWGRILPQIVYYISAYCDLLNAGSIRLGQPINVCVPTGNFGNILSCYYARRMGLPVKRLLCASNLNDVLTRFLHTGVYDRNRAFHATMSPSMDILISSNLERLIFDLSDWDDGLIRDYMGRLAAEGRYEAAAEIRERLDAIFYGGSCGEEGTSGTIARYYKMGYLIDPHTAVAAKVLDDYRQETGDGTPAVFVSTASPYKFCGSVLTAIGETPAEDSMEQIAQLQRISGIAAPAHLAGLSGKEIRFTDVVDKEDMEKAVLRFLQ